MTDDFIVFSVAICVYVSYILMTRYQIFYVVLTLFRDNDLGKLLNLVRICAYWSKVSILSHYIKITGSLPPLHDITTLQCFTYYKSDCANIWRPFLPTSHCPYEGCTLLFFSSQWSLKSARADPPYQVDRSVQWCFVFWGWFTCCYNTKHFTV